MRVSTESVQQRFDRKFIPEPFSGCWLWTDHWRKGYGHLKIMKRGMVKAHRVSWELFRGKIPTGLCVLHKCDTPPCVNPDHLFLGTNADNMADCVSKGRQNKGEHQRHAKLTAENALAIRAIVLAGLSQTVAARQYGVTKQLVSEIVLRKIWKHI